MRWTSRRRFVSLHPGKTEGAPGLLKIPKSECPDIWIRLPRHKWPTSWSNIEHPVVPKKCVRSPTCWPLVGKTIWGISIGIWVGKSTDLGRSFCSPKTRMILIGVCGWHRSGWKKSRMWLQCGRNWRSLWSLTNHHHISTMYIWDALNVNVNRTKTLSINIEKCSNHEFLIPQMKNYQDVRNFTQKLSRGPSTWKDMLENAWNSIVNWQTKRRSNYTRFPVLVWTITKLKRKSWKTNVNCQTFAPILYYKKLVPGTNWSTWHSVVSHLNWHDLSQDGLKHVTDDWHV